MGTPKIRVLIADDDDGLREALADAVRSAPDLEIVGSVGDATEAVREAEATHPDVLLMDVRMPGGGGAAATREVLRRLSDVQVVALSAHEEKESALEMLEAGACAYVVKGVSESEIVEAIRRAHRGQMSLPTDLGTASIRHLVHQLGGKNQTEERLKKHHLKQLAMLDALPEAIVIVNSDGTIELVNAQLERMLGYSREALHGQQVELLLPERYRLEHATKRGTYAASPWLRPMGTGQQLTARRRDGTELHVDISLSPVNTEDETLVVAAVRDVTGRMADEETERQNDRFGRSTRKSNTENLPKTVAHNELLAGTTMTLETRTTTQANPPNAHAKMALRNLWSGRAGVALRVGAILVAYYGSARVGLSLSIGHSNVTPVWLPSGVAVAALVLLGRRYWPALAASAFLVNLTTGLPALVALGLAVGNTLEYIVAVWLLGHMRFRPAMHRLRDVAALSVGGAVAPLVAATLGTASLYWGHIIPLATISAVWATYWVGDGVGIVIFAPPILVWMTPSEKQIERARVAEAVALIAAVAILTWLVFLGGSPFRYLVFPLAIWAAVRFGQRGITVTIIVTAVVAIAGTVGGGGAFTQGTINDRLVSLEVFLAGFALTGLALAAAVLSRHESEEQLRVSTTELEAANRDLHALTHIVSHDLRNPLRAIDVVRGLLESAPDAMVIVDPHGTIQVVNAQTEMMFGYPRGELLGQSVDMLVPDRFREGHSGHRRRYASQPLARPMGAGLDLFGRRKDGSEFPIDISLSPMETADGMLIIAAARDVTDRQEAKRELSELAARLGTAHEEERLRIASDIHDDTIQTMTATSLRMQQLRRHLTDVGQIEMLSKLEEATSESIVRLRRLMFDLRPSSLDRSGLASALRELTQKLQEESSITFTVDSRVLTELPVEVRTALYRIAQEALVNARKHSGATTVYVELTEVGGGCQIKISDNGRGFDPRQTESNDGHFGLVAMRERAKIAGGWWKVHCPPAGGTVVEFWLPIVARSAEDGASGATGTT